jgi:hypothetical protein
MLNFYERRLTSEACSCVVVYSVTLQELRRDSATVVVTAAKT